MIPSSTEVPAIGSWLTTVPLPVILIFRFKLLRIFFASDKVLSFKSGTVLEVLVSLDSEYNFIIEPSIKLLPFAGTWADTNSSSSPEITHSKPSSSNIFLASAIVLFVTSGRLIVSSLLVVVLLEDISK